MINDSERACFELIWVIVNFGTGSKVMQAAKKYGLTGGTIILAKALQKVLLQTFWGSMTYGRR